MNENSENIIFIIYPDEFTCYKKFERKVSFFTKNLNHYRIVFLKDRNSLIDQYVDYFKIQSRQLATAEEAIKIATHAIVFNDRNRFDEIIDEIKENKISIRNIKLELTVVKNKDKGETFDVYIGRGSIWGNPYQIGPDGDRDEVIRKFSYAFERGFLKCSENLEKNILKLKGKELGCHCKPAACHGDIIAAYINSIDDGL